MIAKTTAAIFLLLTIYLPTQDCAILEATIKIESDNIQITSFLDRFKKFIAHSHIHEGNTDENSTIVDKFVQHNDSFQANYDFAQNLLSIGSSYSLIENGTEKKISDVKIILSFRFKQDSHEKIVLEDLHGNALPRIGLQSRSQADEIIISKSADQNEEVNTTLSGQMLSFIVDTTEPIIVAFVGIIINGILGHVLTTAFDHFYYGRLTI